MQPKQQSERGQVLVLLVVGIIALLGFAALAIDGSMVYSERRHAQNAADTAALAGALSKVKGQDWLAAARDRAASNGYVDGATTTVIVNSPPDSGPYVTDDGYVQVRISARVNTAFVHFVYQGLVENTVEAVARARQEEQGALYEGNALVGLKPDGCDGVRVGGTADSEMVGGGVFVNSDDPNCAFRQHGNGKLVVDPPGGISVVGGYSTNAPPGEVSPTPESGAEAVPYPPDPDIPLPSCSGNATVSGNRISPGNWSGADFPPPGVTELGDPDSEDTKIFCVNSSGAFKINAGTELTGHNVLIYMVNGGVQWNGGATIKLDAPDEGDYRGLLLYVDPHNYVNPANETVEINGNSASRITGTIYAPAAYVKLNGTGAEEGYKIQVVGYEIDLLGSNELYVNFDPGENYEATYLPRIALVQ